MKIDEQIKKWAQCVNEGLGDYRDEVLGDVRSEFEPVETVGDLLRKLRNLLKSGDVGEHDRVLMLNHKDKSSSKIRFVIDNPTQNGSKALLVVSTLNDEI